MPTYTLTTLATFTGANGAGPGSLIADNAGNLYGETDVGGASNDSDGTIFEIVNGSHLVVTLATFSSTNGGGYAPEGGLLADQTGNLYGTTSLGSGFGTVFEYVASTGSLQTLVSFPGSHGTHSDSGANPTGNLIADSAGNLYGTTQNGGAYDNGNVFEILKSTGALQAVTSFAFTDSHSPMSGLLSDSAGNLYGTNEAGPGFSAEGAVYEIVKSTGAVQTLATFTGANGAHPYVGLIADSAGNLYGTTNNGGAADAGTVFEIVKSTGALQTLYAFSGGGDGAHPNGLVADSTGNLYGTTGNGGASGDGTVFEIVKSTGAFQTLFSFSGADGDDPQAGLIVDGAGNLYGTTFFGGPSDAGTVFELSPSTTAPPANISPTISGAQAGQADGAGVAINLFSQVAVTDPDAGQTETVTVSFDASHGTFTGAGFAGANGVYTAGFASAAAAQAALRAATFTPTAGLSATTTFTIAVGDGQATATDSTTSVAASYTAPPSSPSVGGAVSGQATTDRSPIQPFSSVTVADPNAGGSDTVVIAYAGANGVLAGGGFAGTPGSYSASFASAAAAQAALHALIFTPTTHEVAPGQTATTGFTLTITDGSASASNAGASVVATSLNTAPVIAGATASQSDTAGAAISPFATATVTDPDTGQSDVVTVSFAAANGTLSGGGFVQTAPGVYTVTEPAGAAGVSAAAVQADLRAATFTPTIGQSGVTTLTVSVNDGLATATDATTSVIASYTAPSTGGGGGGGTAVGSSSPLIAAGFSATQTPNVLRASPTGVDATTPGTPIYAEVQAEKAIATQFNSGQITQAQAESQLLHLADGTTAVAVASYGFFTGYTPTAAGLDYLVHSPDNPADLNDPYYAKFSTDNRYINFAVSLATGPGAGAAAFQANYGSLSLADATAKAYLAVFGAVADAAKVSALLDTLVPDGLGGQETRAQYFAQYGGDGPNGQGTKAAAIGFLLAHAVEDGSGVYGAATEHYLAAIADGIAPTMGSELALTYALPVSLAGVSSILDHSVSG